MAQTTKSISMSSDQIQKLYQKYSSAALSETRPKWTEWSLKLPEGMITAYSSGKVVFQGEQIDQLIPPAFQAGKVPEKDQASASKKAIRKETSGAKLHSASMGIYPQAGSDEVGTGDFFGPIVVAHVLISDQKTAEKIEAMGVTDSKAMTDEKIREIAPELENLVTSCVMVFYNSQFNRIFGKNGINMNTIKSKMHNQGYVNLQNIAGSLPGFLIIDQFCPEKKYYEHLQIPVPGSSKPPVVISGIHFETKAESKYVSVAAASVLARARFLQEMDAMSREYDFEFPRGAGPAVDVKGRDFVQKHGSEALKDTAKLNFSNLERIV